MEPRTIQPGRYGEAPAFQLLYSEGRAVSNVARVVGVDPEHLRNALKGRCRPRPELVERLSQLLNRPAEELFTEAALAEPFGSRN